MMVLRVTALCFCLIIFFMVEADRSCPSTNGNEPEIIPNKRDCTKFFICDNGRAWPQNCSAGLYFNPTLEVCDRPENVVFCEYDDFVYMKPHCNCSKYVICNFGSLEVRDCVQGYHFSERSVYRLQLTEDYSNPCELGDCE